MEKEYFKNFGLKTKIKNKKLATHLFRFKLINLFLIKNTIETKRKICKKIVKLILIKFSFDELYQSL